MAKKNNRLDPMANVKTMGKEGVKIIKDIAFGKYNIFDNGHVFRNLEFVKAIIIEVDKRIIDLTIHINAINIAYYGSNDPNVMNLLYRDSRSLEAWTLVKNIMTDIIMSGGDTGFLLVLANKLPAYKYNI